MNGLEMAGALPVSAPTPADRLAALFDAHHDRLYRLARRLAPTADDARDLVQDTFLKAARSATSVPVRHADEEAWLVRVLVNIRRDQWRKAAVRKRHDDDVRRAPVRETDKEGALVAHAAVWRALDVLAPRRRAIVVMHELEGLTAKDVASLLGISAITVRWHLSRGRRDLCSPAPRRWLWVLSRDRRCGAIRCRRASGGAVRSATRGGSAGGGLQAAHVGNSTRVVYVHSDAIVTNADITRSSVVAGDTPSRFWIDVQLNPDGAAKMRNATSGHIGRPVAIMIDGDVVSAPTVKSAIGSSAIISGDYARDQAQRIVSGMVVTGSPGR